MTMVQRGLHSDFRFADFEVDVAAQELRKGGVKVHLESQPFQVLLALLDRPGEVVTRNELKECLWHGQTFVDFNNGVNHAISKIRHAPGDSASRPHFVETLPRRGYRFIAHVEINASSGGLLSIRNLRRWTRYAGVGLTAIFVGVTLYYLVNSEGKPVRAGSFEGNRPPPVYRFQQLTHDTGLTHQPAISRDGSMVVYSSDRGGNGNFDIWMQHVAGGKSTQLTFHEADDRWPDLSPDGRQVVFESDRDGGGIFVVPAFGGPPRLLARQGHHPRISPDGKWVAYSDGGPYYSGLFRPWGSSAIHIVSVGGGETHKLETGTGVATQPVWSPDSKHILFLGAPDENNNPVDAQDWWIVPIEGGQAVQTGARKILAEAGVKWPAVGMAEAGRWLAGPDRLAFGGRSGETENIFQLAISPKNLLAMGPLRQLTQGTSEAQPALGRNGRIAFSARGRNDDIWSAEIDAKGAEVKGQLTPLFTSMAQEFQPSVSLDGRRLAFNRLQLGQPDVFIWEVETGVERPLVATPEQREIRALISPNGKTVAFERGNYGNLELFVIPFAGGAERKVADVTTITSWTWDSRRVVAVVDKQWATIDVLTGETAHLFDLPGPDLPALSPDGRWVSFNLLESHPVFSIYVAPLRNGIAAPRSEWIKATTDRYATRSRWFPGSDMLYFISERDGFRCLRAQRLHPETKRPVGEQLDVLSLHDKKRSLIEAWPHGLAADRLYVQVRENHSNIWLAEPVGR